MTPAPGVRRLAVLVFFAMLISQGLLAGAGIVAPVLATLAARIVPGLVVDVPDQYLIDLERLAVTAWSARDQPTGKRGRTMIPPAAVAAAAHARIDHGDLTALLYLQGFGAAEFAEA